MAESLLYLQNFFRFIILFVFTLSSIGKVRDIQAFEQSIVNFALLPRKLVQTSALFLLASEICVAVLLLLGGKWLGVGFALAIAQLTIFSVALASVLARKIQTPCNCFGSNEKLVSRFDLWRNGGFIACALVGMIGSTADSSLNMSFFETGLIAIMALPLVLISINLGDLVQLFD